jgi:hypothetical protein
VPFFCTYGETDHTVLRIGITSFLFNAVKLEEVILTNCKFFRLCHWSNKVNEISLIIVLILFLQVDHQSDVRRRGVVAWLPSKR